MSKGGKLDHLKDDTYVGCFIQIFGNELKWEAFHNFDMQTLQEELISQPMGVMEMVQALFQGSYEHVSTRVCLNLKKRLYIV